jgi:hypothetical protein
MFDKMYIKTSHSGSGNELIYRSIKDVIKASELPVTAEKVSEKCNLGRRTTLVALDILINQGVLEKVKGNPPTYRMID